MHKAYRSRRLVLGFVTAVALGAAAGGARASVFRVSVRNISTQATGASRAAPAAVSPDGRFVVFESDTNGKTDVFLRDRQTNLTHQVSVATGGGQVNDHSRGPSVSSDGRFVAFSSIATNLVLNDTNGVSDVFVHDRLNSGETKRVSIRTGFFQAGGESFDARISADGRFVAFRSTAPDLVAGDTNGLGDIFVHDRQTDSTERVSVATGGGQATAESFGPSISADGRYVAFSSLANNLVAGDTGASDIFVRDRLTGTTTRVSVSSAGVQANEASVLPSISSDGRYVAFESLASNLVAGDTNMRRDVFVRDRQTGTTQRVSVGALQGNNQSSNATISLDGRYVAFLSSATNLIASDTNGVADVFVRDRVAGATWRASVTAAGVAADGASALPSISADGKTIAFTSTATNLVGAADTNGVSDVFVWTPNPLAITTLHCESVDCDVVCDVYHDGGWGPTDVRWTINGTHQSAFDDQDSLFRSCVPGTWLQVQVVVSDQLPSSDTESRSVRCVAGF